MSTRIGNVAYWAGCIVGFMLSLSGLGITLERGPDGLVMVLFGALAVGIGWAIRYVLSGRQDWGLGISR